MYQRILVPVDGSPPSEAGLKLAIEMAKLTGGQLRLLHVVDPMPFAFSAEGYGAMATDVLALMRESGEQILRAARERVVQDGVAAETVLLDGFGGRLCDRVGAQVQEWKADLIVIGTHGRRGVRRMMLGSDAEQVLRTAPVPVLLVRPPEPAAPADKEDAELDALL